MSSKYVDCANINCVATGLKSIFLSLVRVSDSNQRSPILWKIRDVLNSSKIVSSYPN